ncbi:MAG: efflux transporter outer membrane subunit [Thermodesulfobacteriota bacterium]
MKKHLLYTTDLGWGGGQRHRLQSAAVGLALLALSGCANLAPSFTRPEGSVPETWPAGAAYKQEAAGKSGCQATEVGWQEYYGDERLKRIITLALANNRDLRVAALTVERARAQHRIQRAELLPQVDASASASSQRIPEDLSASGKAQTVDQYSVALGVSSFELDLFGRVRNLEEQALAEYLATEEAHRAVQISLVAEVAVAYLNTAADRERLELARQTLTAQQVTHELMQRRFELGVASELEVRQAQTRVEAARVDVARYTTQVAQDENELNLLVGAPVPAELLPESLTGSLAAVAELTPGLPAEILLRRPDILAAEQHLKGVNASIGAARAAFFPRVTLTGSMGLGSDGLAGLFDADSGAWLFAPKITLPIFDAGSRWARLWVAEADRDIALARYEKAIQTAFREVADALALQGTIAEQLAAQEALTEASNRNYLLSQARYEKGVDSYLAVLDAQRSLYAAQQGLIATRLTRQLNLVTLYKVLGGGGEG